MGKVRAYSKRVPRAGKRKCYRCKELWYRERGVASKICGRCETHCVRCDVELTEDNITTKQRKSRLFYCSTCLSEIKKLCWKNDSGRRERARDGALVKNYGITSVEYDAMLKAQNGACWICEKPPKEGGNRLAVDHLHSKGEKQRNPREKRGRCRGLLCWHCNSALGKFGDSVTKLRRAALYLETWPAQKILKKEIDGKT